jgi:hypothetical protein
LSDPTPCANLTAPTGKQVLDAKVRWLPPNQFDFLENGGSDPTGGTAGSGTYTRPQNFAPLDPQNTQQYTIATDLTTAFNQAPPWFRKSLCELDYVFVDASTSPVEGGTPEGWAFWENPTQAYQAWLADQSTPKPPIAPEQFIAISSSVWPGNPAGDALGRYETGVLQALLGPNNAPYPTVTAAAATGGSTWSLMLLGILSHELGHVYWHSECFHGCNAVQGPGWTDVSGVPSLHTFNILSTTAVPGTNYSVTDVKNDWTSNGSHPLNSKLYDLYTRGVFPSLFGLVAPDEDMAETTKLLVLYKSGLSSLKVMFPGGTHIDMISILTATPAPYLLGKINHIRGSRQFGD